MAESPTVRQRQLGMRLRGIRTQLGLNVDEVAEALMCSPSKISRLETATRSPNLRDIRDLCRVYKIEKATADELMDLARKAKEPGWWSQYTDLRLDPYIGLEQDASDITSFATFYIPALLQTEEYARAIIKGIAPRIDPAVLQERIEVRLRRQERLEQDHPPRYRVLIDEAVLHRPTGGPGVMVAQIEQSPQACRGRQGYRASRPVRGRGGGRSGQQLCAASVRRARSFVSRFRRKPPEPSAIGKTG